MRRCASDFAGFLLRYDCACFSQLSNAVSVPQRIALAVSIPVPDDDASRYAVATADSDCNGSTAAAVGDAHWYASVSECSGGKLQ